MKRILLATAALLAMAAASPAMAGCYVNDPTGTPLNIRTSPNGQIVGTLGNDTPVSLLDQTNHNGRTSAYVGDPHRRPLGWVFRDYVACEYTSVQMPPELVGNWCYDGGFSPANYHHCAEDDLDGGESIIIRPGGYLAPEGQVGDDIPFSKMKLNARPTHIDRDQRGVYTIVFDTKERWVLWQTAPGHIVIRYPNQEQSR